MTTSTQPHLDLARHIAERYAALPPVEAVALGGSLVSGLAGAEADIDLYVYSREPVPLSARAGVAAGASRAEIDNQFWESGDEWIDAATGLQVDVMFRSVAWIEGELNRVLVQHQASVGYSTAIWHNVRASRALYDRSGWFAALQRRAAQPYPEPLVRAIVAKNHPILRDTLSSYLVQLTKAVKRADWTSVNHRVAALLASYFDIVFAVNRLPHPGEKRQVQIAAAQCTRLPDGMAAQVEALVQAAVPGGAVSDAAQALLDGLDVLLRAEGMLP
jgi:hypothetical protein